MHECTIKEKTSWVVMDRNGELYLVTARSDLSQTNVEWMINFNASMNEHRSFRPFEVLGEL